MSCGLLDVILSNLSRMLFFVFGLLKMLLLNRLSLRKVEESKFRPVAVASFLRLALG